MPVLRIICLLALAAACNAAAEPRIVFVNGASAPVSAFTLQGDKLVVRSAVDGFSAGQTLALQSADFISGEKPTDVNAGIALLLAGKPKEARDVLQPIVDSQRAAARIDGNHWVEAARALLLAHALLRDADVCTRLGKEISDATPASGLDPFTSLAKALQMPAAAVDERRTTLSDLTTDNLPADIRAYASYYLGDLLAAEKMNAEALEAFLSVPGLHPTGGRTVLAAAEIRGSDLLTAMGRREEAVALLESARIAVTETALADEVGKRLESLK
jgi:tetratricopeptide (TPR) repeat protein